MSVDPIEMDYYPQELENIIARIPDFLGLNNNAYRTAIRAAYDLGRANRRDTADCLPDRTIFLGIQPGNKQSEEMVHIKKSGICRNLETGKTYKSADIKVQKLIVTIPIPRSK